MPRVEVGRPQAWGKYFFVLSEFQHPAFGGKMMASGVESVTIIYCTPWTPGFLLVQMQIYTCLATDIPISTPKKCRLENGRKRLGLAQEQCLSSGLGGFLGHGVQWLLTETLLEIYHDPTGELLADPDLTSAHPWPTEQLMIRLPIRIYKEQVKSRLFN